MTIMVKDHGENFLQILSKVFGFIFATIFCGALIVVALVVSATIVGAWISVVLSIAGI